MEDYYELLGVSHDASTADIKQAYRERIKQEHPDVSDEDAASERAKQVIRAKEVLTDPSERQRYDRLGHDAYVSEEANPTPRGNESGDAAESAGSDASTDDDAEPDAAAAEDTASGAGGAAAGTGQASAGTGQASAGTGTDGTTQRDFGAGTSSWYDSSPGEGSAGTAGGATAAGSPAWDPERSYSVKREGGNLQAMDIFSSQRSIVMFLSTFLVYPILLFGSLSPQFPLAVNLIVAACTVLIIAFLQSVPSVGMVVFGLWTLLLPPILVLWIGVDLFSLVGLLAVTGVIFPFGLSVLTRVAIRPMSIS